MKMRTRIGVVLAILVAACLGLLWWFETLPGRQLEAAKSGYAAHGAEYTSLIDPLTNELVHVFRMPRKTHDADLDVLPDLPFDFGLDLRDSQVMSAGLQKLQGLKRLYYLELPG